MDKLKIKDWEDVARLELDVEDETMIKEEIKERLKEIRGVEKVLKKLEKKYNDFLERDANDLF